MAKLRHFLQFNDFSRAEFAHLFSRVRVDCFSKIITRVRSSSGQ